MFGVEPICRALRQYGVQVAPSTYYAFKARPPSARSLSDQMLIPRLLRAFQVNYSCYGARKLWRELRSEGLQVGRDRVARLMRIAGTRRILGFTVATSMTANLVTRALEQAVATRRRGQPGFSTSGLIHHADRGSQYTSLALSKRLRELGIELSTGRTGTALDNAAMETTIGLYKTELINTKRWTSRQEVETATTQWVAWFNQKRLHSALGYQSPTNYETSYYRNLDLPRQAT